MTRQSSPAATSGSTTKADARPVADLGGQGTLAGSRSTLVDDVAARIRDSIFSGQLAPGTKLQQEATAAQLGISRLPVRHAFIKLEGEGLVYQLGNRGTYVAPLTQRDILDHFVLFGMVSGLAVAATTEQLTDDMLANLERLNERVLNSSTAEERSRANWAFHVALNKGGASRRTLSVLKSLSGTIPRGRFATEDLDDARVEHQTILDAMRARDAAAAQAAVVAHLRSSGQRTVQEMADSGFWADTVDSDQAH